jgi:TRAP-type C4-dicarboxylate transport system permease small subunit
LRLQAARERRGERDVWSRVGIVLERATRGLALAGGLLLVGVLVMTVMSVAGRYLFDAPIPGDYEITELACGVAVFAFLPYCQLHRANIVVEFFTTRLPPQRKRLLDAVHSLAFTVVAVLLAWRLAVGGLGKMADGQTTLYLGIPLFWGYLLAFIGAVTLCLVCVWVFTAQVRALRR